MTVTIPGVRVPLALVADPSRVGGTLDQDCLHGDLVIRDGVVRGMTPATGGAAPFGIVTPRLSDPHVHLDKCHTISRLNGVGGDLRKAIEAQRRDWQTWTEDDIRARAGRGLDELIAAGCDTMRSHVDWGLPDDPAAAPLAWSVMHEMAQEYCDKITLELAPLIGVAELAQDTLADRIARDVARTSNILGTFILDQPGRRDGIRNAFRVAGKRGMALDFHVDEGLQSGLDGLEMIADAAIETGFEGPILCGHACALMNLGQPAFGRLADKLARARISIVSLPSANLYLQGRTIGTPDRRGITRIQELRAAGVNVVVGTDNVRDAFCPLGRFDPRQSLALASLAAHLDPPFGQYLPMITTDARVALGLPPRHVDRAAPGDLILFEATTTADLLGGVSPPRPLSSMLQGDAA